MTNIRNVVLLMILVLCFFTGCKATDVEQSKISDITSVNNEGIKVGVVKGYIFEEEAKKAFPMAEICAYNSREDTYKALDMQDVDCVVDDEPIIRAKMRSADTYTIISEYVEPSDYGFTFTKNRRGKRLKRKFNRYLKGIKKNGSIEYYDNKWFGKLKDNKKSENFKTLPPDNGIITIAYDESNIPFAYMSGEYPVGYDVDIAIGFCKQYRYGIEFKKVNFSDMLNGVHEGKYDIGCGAITITDERKEKLLFSKATYSGGISVCVLDASRIADVFEKEEDRGFFSDFIQDLKNSFVNENRFLLYLKGFLITSIVTVLSIIIGLVFGVILYILGKRGILIVRGLVRLFVFVFYCVPPIILIMMIYYTYYTDISFGGIMAAVIGFSFAFAGVVYSTIDKYVKEYDETDMDREYRLLFIDTKVLFKRLLLSFGENIIDDLSERAVLLLKATSVIGIIAVNDMTKVVEVIRNSSYELALPLVFTFFMYIVLVVLFKRALGRIKLALIFKIHGG